MRRAFLVRDVAVVLAGFAVAGAGIAWAVVAMSPRCSCARRRTCRAASTRRSTTWWASPQTVSIALGAGLVGFVDYRALIVVMSAVTALCGAYLLSARQLPTGRRDGGSPPNVSAAGRR